MDFRELWIACDASIKTFENGRTFGCPGAIVMNNPPSVGASSYRIIPDTTNNRCELVAVYLAVKLAQRQIEFMNIPQDQVKVTIFSDSKLAVYGLKEWIHSWARSMDDNGIMYNYAGTPVKNQDLYAMILNYMAKNNLRFNLRHCKGHMNPNDSHKLAVANRVFNESNGYMLSPEDIYKVCYYNNMVDNSTRAYLEGVDPNKHTSPNILSSEPTELCRSILPKNFGQYFS